MPKPVPQADRPKKKHSEVVFRKLELKPKLPVAYVVDDPKKTDRSIDLSMTASEI